MTCSTCARESRSWLSDGCRLHACLVSRADEPRLTPAEPAAAALFVRRPATCAAGPPDPDAGAGAGSSSPGRPRRRAPPRRPPAAACRTRHRSRCRSEPARSDGSRTRRRPSPTRVVTDDGVLLPPSAIAAPLTEPDRRHAPPAGARGPQQPPPLPRVRASRLQAPGKAAPPVRSPCRTRRR